jgi:hypothetical protein
MTIEQTIEIPANGWIHLDIPPELAGANGKVVVTAQFPTAKTEATARQQRTERYLAARQRLRELCKNSKLTSDDFLEQRRKDKELEDRLDVLHEEERRHAREQKQVRE